MPRNLNCPCHCRMNMRIITRGFVIGYVGEDSYMTFEELDSLWINDREFFESYEQMMTQTITHVRAIQLLDILKDCQCCERHMDNRPEILF